MSNPTAETSTTAIPGAATFSGSCLCGKVTIGIERLLRHVVFCHCTLCRKQSGHYFAAISVRDEDLLINGAEHLTWYSASADARRGFCGHCGSVLFWKSLHSNATSVLAGCLDQAANLSAEAHIFTEGKGNYYTLSDGLPQFPQAD